MADSRARDEQMIAALKRERAEYVARGMDERVAEVDEQLTKYGHEHAEDQAPKGRRSPAKQTAQNTQKPADDDAPKGRTSAETGKQTAAGKDDASAKSRTAKS